MSEREAFERIERQFTSGNSVSVDRASVRKEDWEAAKKYAARQSPASGDPVAVCDECGYAYGPTSCKCKKHIAANPPAKVPEGIPPEVSEADLFWNADDMENGMRDPQQLADRCGGDLQQGETMIVDVLMAKELPIRRMKIWVDSDDMIDYEWTDQPPQEQ